MSFTLQLKEDANLGTENTNEVLSVPQFNHTLNQLNQPMPLEHEGSEPSSLQVNQDSKTTQNDEWVKVV